MEIASGRTLMVVNPRSGALEKLEDRAREVSHLSRVEPDPGPVGLVRLLVPGERWSSRYADCGDQSPPEVHERDRGAVLRWSHLVAADGRRLDVQIELRIEPSERTDELLLALELQNRSEWEINQVIFPWLGCWTGLDGPGTDQMAFGACTLADPYSLPRPAGNTYARNHQRLSLPYPVSLYAPWFDISGATGGLGLLSYMAEPRNCILALENLAGYGPGMRLAFGWAHQTVIPAGERWQSPPIGLAAHGGDWHETADRYREWFSGMFTPDASRHHLRSMIGFQNVFFRGFDGSPIRPLEQIPQVAEAGRRYGVDHLCVWDSLTLGNYAKQADLDLLDYRDEERELLARGLRQAEAHGTRTSALINFRHPVATRALRDGAISGQVQRRYDGTARTENFSGSHHHAGLKTPYLGPESWVYSPFSEAHRERVLRLTRGYLDIGYTSMFYDQPFEVWPDYGFLEDGWNPERTHGEALSLIADVRRELLANDPTAIVIGEECDILATPWVDMWMSWRISNPAAADDVVTTRYGIPHTMLAWVVDSEPERAALAFALGMYLCLMVHGGEGTVEDEPELANLVGALAALRRSTADRTVNARFIDRRGLEIDGDEGLVAWGYDSPEGPAVIAAAPGTAARGRVAVERSAFTAPGAADDGTLHHLDGTGTPAGGDAIELDLAANEVAVWIL
ncbi:MAG: hypothetical protein U9R79_00150 [Armatimonadota bacterium]|nr:hypothetical protein [Armatimonadota bacterium]